MSPISPSGLRTGRGGQDMRLIAGPRRKLTSQITSQHQIQHEEAVLVILESITHVNDKGMINLWAPQHGSATTPSIRRGVWGRTSSNSRRS